MKKILILIALLAGGCGTDHHITREESMKVTTRGNDVMHYVLAIGNEVRSHIPPGNFSGMRCTVRLALAPDGSILSAKNEGGDKALCDAALKAIQAAKIPPAPSDEVYELLHNVPLDFKY